MPTHSKPRRPLSYFHVAGRPGLNGKRCCVPDDYRNWQDRFNRALAMPPLRLLAYCLLPHAWHLVVGPTDPRALHRCLAWVIPAHPETTSAPSVVALTDIDSLVHTTREVERQALTLGLVRRAQDWPWGSLAGRLDQNNPLPLASAPFLESRAWAEFVNRPSTDRRDSANVSQDPRRLTKRPERRHHLGRI